MSAAYNYTDGVYNCDPYNEQTPSSNDPSYMAEVGRSIYGAMEAVDANATWCVRLMHEHLYTP
jgi:alpha-N-acetylglucosaminidase